MEQVVEDNINKMIICNNKMIVFLNMNKIYPYYINLELS